MNYRNIPGADEYNWLVEVKTEAHLDYWIKECFDGIDIKHEDDGTTLLTGVMEDLSAVYGFILQLRDAGILLISLRAEKHAKELKTIGGC